MKKFLFWILSAVLAAVVALPTSAGPLAKKNGVQMTSSVEELAKPASSEKRMPNVLTSRSKKSTEGVFRTAQRALTLSQAKQARTQVLAEGVQLPDLRGFLIYSELEGASVGVYKVASAVPEFLYATSSCYAAFQIEDKYYLTNLFSFWGMTFVTNEVYEVESGELLASQTGSVDNILYAGVYVPTEGVVYGVGYNSTGSGLQYAKYEYHEDASITVTPICDYSTSVNSMAMDSEGQIYAITYTAGAGGAVDSSTLCKLDKETGALTTIGETGQLPQYLSSATIDTKTNKMYWVVCAADESSILCEVDLATGAATPVLQYTYGDEIVGMHVPAPEAADGAPAVPENLTASFEGGSLTGTVEFDAPTTHYDGSEATGDLSYKVYANGAVVASASDASYGSHVSVPVTLTTPGVYKFVVTVANLTGDTSDSPKAKYTTFVGNGVPSTPEVTATYEEGQATVTWNRVTTSADGGYIDPAAVTYTVTRQPDSLVVAENVADTVYTEVLAEPENCVSYKYSVVAQYAGAESAAGVSNALVLGSIVPPYSNDFATEDKLEGYTIIDANEDGTTWAYTAGEARVKYNTKLAMDDWMITPPVKLEAGKAYKVTFDTRGQSDYYQERLEVKWGTSATVEGMTNVLVDSTDVVSSVAVTLSAYIVPETDGLYYVGFHGISDVDEYYLFVDNVQISAGTSSSAPGAATNATVTADPTGALKATVTFNAPSVDYAGQTLEELTDVVVKRGDSVVVATFENPEMGGELTVVDDGIEASGVTTYTIQGHNTSGEGLVATASAYVGFDVPAAPTTVTLVETEVPGQVTLSWSAVTTDANGLTYPEGYVQYVVAEYNNGWVAMTEPMSATTYTFQAVEDGAQDFVQYAVFPVTVEGTGMGLASELVVAGYPYFDFQESFAGGELTYAWATGYTEGGSWSLYSDDQFDDLTSQDNDGGYAGMRGSNLDDKSSLYTGKIDLSESVNPGVKFYTYNIIGEEGDEDINEINVYVSENCGAEWTLVKNLVVCEAVAEPGWGQVVVSLADYAGKTVQVRFEGVTKMFAYTLIDNVYVGSLLAHDLKAVALEAPAKVVPGAEFTITAKVANLGVETATNAQLELYDLATWEVAETKTLDAVAPGASASAEFTVTMSALATEEVSYFVRLVYDEDENPENNYYEYAVVTPKVTNLPTVQNLSGEQVAEGVKLTWEEPNLDDNYIETKTEDFEDAESFAQELEGWTFIDGDQSPVGGFKGTEIPGITPGTTLASFFVMDNTYSSFQGQYAPSYEAHSGNKYLAALFRYDDGQTNDWAISPVLSGNAQTISFYAKSYSASYPETISICYSTGSLDTNDFVELVAVAAVPKDWTLYEAELPEGAVYFAIHSYATGSFMLEVDDVTYEAGSSTSNLSILGYDVYRNGVKLNTEPVGETEYVDTEASADEVYEYHVLAVYDGRGTSVPVGVTVQTSGLSDLTLGKLSVKSVDHAVVVAGAEGEELTISSVDGKVVYAGVAEAKTTVPVNGGVYLVKVGEKVVKLIVK